MNRGGLLTALTWALTAAACRGGSDAAPLTQALPPQQAPITVDTRIADPEGLLVSAVEVVREFWATTTGDRLVPGGVIAVRPESPPRCGDEQLKVEAFAGNALYCPSERSILIDVDGLAARVLQQNGPIGVALIVAHEIGHDLQSEANLSLDPLVAELQADCYAGVFAAGLTDGSVSGWAASTQQLARPARAILDLRDRPGTHATDEGAHGTGLDRISALLDGLQYGPDHCDRYRTNPPVVTGQRFRDAQEEITRGDTGLAALLVTARADLDMFFTDVARSLGLRWRPTASIALKRGTGCLEKAATATVQFCGDDQVIVQRDTLEVLASLGEVAVWAELTRGWAVEAQSRATGVFDPARGTDCLLGFWLGAHHPGSRTTHRYPYILPPGGLDQVIEGMLTAPPEDNPLYRIVQLLDGFHHGRKACEAAERSPHTTNGEGAL